MSKYRISWNTKENANAYDKYATGFSMYKNTSRDLVKISDVKPGMTIIDLAAGTGATTQEIINAVGDNVRIIAIDQAEAMVKKAQEKFKNRKNMKFIVAEAENLCKVVKEPVDVVICNSAFWQMRIKTTFRNISDILKDDGLFAFNLPDQFFSYRYFKNKPRNPLPYNLKNLTSWAKDNKLTLIAKSVKEYSKTADEIITFSKIPVMSRNFKSAKGREDFIANIKKHKNSKKNQWLYLVFKKTEKRKSIKKDRAKYAQSL
ncbi:MAG: class I SAM-dependent methyltransferase [Candidatus Paceibacterota bacterium]|nr:MAG: class I SAM-dependent methyltransferase [Candidatus Paceibacterota bacterium]